MAANDVFLDGFTRVRDSVHRIVGDLSQEELHKEPHPSIGWLAWRLTRVEDSNISRLWGGKQELWIAEWGAKLGMQPAEGDFGRGAAHTREQVKAFKATKEQILGYHDATFELTKAYLDQVTQQELDRELQEPQYTPLPTVAVRIMSVLENGMNNTGQMGYLKAYHRIGGWFPGEVEDRQTFR